MAAPSATAIREQASETGGRTLEIFANTPRLNAWMFSKLAAGVRGDVLEGGSGIGNISHHLRDKATHLVVTDTEPHYLRDLQAAFSGDAGVDVAAFDLDGPPPPVVAARQYDAIVMVNVIEHIADDHGLVARLAGMLKPGGSLLVYVPACPFVFGSLDVALGHHRRYTPDSLASLMRSADLEPTPPRYVNLLGLAGWWLNGRVFKRSQLSARAVALFERLMPLIRFEDRFRLPIGLGLCTHATKVAR
jgi:SAM-dependent methyltransferase